MNRNKDSIGEGKTLWHKHSFSFFIHYSINAFFSELNIPFFIPLKVSSKS